jgi:hypothetical protein
MLIAIDRSFVQFDRALIGLATNFRDAFRSRAGGFAVPMVSTIATAIAWTIATAAIPRLPDCPRMRPRRVASGASRYGALTVSVKMRQSV